MIGRILARELRGQFLGAVLIAVTIEEGFREMLRQPERCRVVFIIAKLFDHFPIVEIGPDSLSPPNRSSGHHPPH